VAEQVAHPSVRPRLRLVRPGEVSPATAAARAERAQRRTLRVLLGSSAILIVVGVVMVLSASSITAFAVTGSSFFFFKRQLLFVGLGLVLFVVTARAPYSAWRTAWGPLAAVTLVLLVLVLHPSSGASANGSARWVTLGPLTIQPSELAKLVTVAAAAAIFARNRAFVNDPLRLVTPLLLVVVPMLVLIMLQPDLGTTMVIVATVFLLLYIVGVRLRTLLLTFVQIVQSLMALGSGHWLGVGLGASRQKWMFVPNAHTDFIFAIIGEETGLIGEAVVIALFAVFIWAGVRIALRAPDMHGRLLAAGITGWIAFQAVVNMGAVTGLLPITGIPLPFVSYGGSSLVVSMVAVGVLVSVGRETLQATTRRRRRLRAQARARSAP